MTVVKEESGQDGSGDDPGTPRGDDGYVPSQRRIEREAYKRARARRATAIAALSTLVTAVVLYLIVVGAPGWPRTKETFFNGQYAREALPKVLEGLWLNVRLLLVCGAAVLVLGMLIAVARTLKGPVFFPLRVLAAAYTDFFRGLPLIINLMIVVLGVPALRLQGVTVDPVLLGGTALTLTYSAYVAEVFRAGIESVHPSQRAAARSLGLTKRQALRHVVLPQAVRRQVPPLLNDLVSLQKDTGLVSIGGAVDAVRAADIIVGRSLNYTPYIIAGLVFVALTIPMTRFTDWVTARMDRRRAQGGTL
ncbi:amino acid ABC transporter permease [Streptomyces sp. MI02-2A]|uniref:amino acid ABC transporter permease n=1 Tax=unclassified Streptomyces TaxID=2593676 RepID=UPI000740DA5C|nr:MULTISPECIES: amino acid ABC transporter permease [unclassified Streptomyces]KUJ37775.1 ABC transporter permease [Streptomyces sp. NRRL F-5122]MDX3263198.1 amino acid ABC transporter permease [Streptomyces sp. MI02-2A]REE58687.1 amino acid ABC transporter membrane protein (PAAT family) [Streptomyces sp. 3212.3]